MLRSATGNDVRQMVALSGLKRSQYEVFAPTFWRQAKDAADRQVPFLSEQLGKPNVICLVSDCDGQLDGFILASVVSAPPVYDPRSLVCMVDDFVVASAGLWATVGASLLQEARRLARLQSAGLAVVVCGHQDGPKRAMLRSAGLYVASEWYVSP